MQEAAGSGFLPVTYNSGSGAFAGRGTWPPAGAQTGDGRVSGVIQPKPREPAKPDAKAPEGTRLQPSTTLSEPSR